MRNTFLMALLLMLTMCGGEEEPVVVVVEEPKVPAIDKIEPLSGLPGSVVTLFGSGFLSQEVSPEVFFINSTNEEFKADIKSVTEDKIEILVPELKSGLHLVRVKVGEQSAKFEVAQFSVLLPKLSITSFAPLSGLPGDQVRLEGEGFTLSTKLYLVDEDGEEIQVTASLNQGNLLFGIPDIARKKYSVKIEDKEQQTTAEQKLKLFEVLSITSMSPSTGYSGSEVVKLEGFGFDENSTGPLLLHLKDPSGNSVAIGNPITTMRSIEFPLPELFPGNYSIQISGSNQVVISDHFVVKQPEVTSVSGYDFNSGVGTFTIHGKGFSKTISNNLILFVSSSGIETQASSSGASSNEITVIIPGIEANSGYDIKLSTGPSTINQVVLLHDANITVRPSLPSVQPFIPPPTSMNRNATNNFSFDVRGLSTSPSQTILKLIDQNLGDPGTTADLILTVNSVTGGKLGGFGNGFTTSEAYKLRIIVNDIESAFDYDVEVFNYPDWPTFSPNSTTTSIPQLISVTGTLLDGINKIGLRKSGESTIANISSFTINSPTSMEFTVPAGFPIGVYTMQIEKPTPFLGRTLRLSRGITLTIN